ncbi:MAG: DNA polymerase I [Spirochaetales bacterium]
MSSSSAPHDRQPKVLLLDAFALIFRSYHAFVDRPILNADGKNINAYFGFFKTLFQLVREQKPTHLVVMYDSRTPTFRDALFDQYKAHRDAAPDDLLSNLPWIEETLTALGVPVMQQDGFEADDLIATGSRWCQQRGVECVIVSNDKDLMQLVGGSVTILRSGFKGGWSRLGPDEVFKSKGVRPEQIADWLALVGDTADNIPGVKGIGDKTAIQLLADYGSLDGIYERLAEITKVGVKKNLEEGRDNAKLSKSLTILREDLELGFSLETTLLTWKPGNAAADLFLKQNSKSLAAEARVLAKLGAAAEAGQLGLDPPNASDPEAEPGPTGPQPLVGDYEAILTLETLDAWIARLRAVGAGAVDLETDSLDTFRCRLVGLSLACEEGKAAYLPLLCATSGELGGPELLDQKVVLERLKPLLEDPEFCVVGQNFKFDWKILRRLGVTVPRIGFDTMLAAWLLDAGAGQFGLEVLGVGWLGVKGIAFGDLVGKGKTFADVPLESAVKYGAEDADLTWRLYRKLAPKLEAAGLTGLLHDLELPLSLLLARMEDEGIVLRGDELATFGVELVRRIADIEAEIFALCGKQFNLGSPKQLQEILFIDRQLTPPSRAKIKTGYSTDSDILEELAEQDPVPAKILAWRSLSKLKSTYVETLPQLVHPSTGRVHTQYMQTGTATGRLASKDPNLQNIPIREDDGRRIRTAFVPREGWRFVSADYSQIELVVLAHLCGDANLVGAFRDGVDIHKRTASLMLGVPLEQVTSDMRRAAKAINFGLMYGMSAFRLANELKISRKEAQAFFDAYKREFSRVDGYFQEVIALAEKTGEVTTMLGHKRALPNINGRNRVEKQAAERVAMNTPIQGSAADLVKLAMLAVDKALSAGGFQAKLLLQVHDELLLEVPEHEVEPIQALLRREMEAVMTLNVPLRVGIESGLNWGELH